MGELKIIPSGSFAVTGEEIVAVGSDEQVRFEANIGSDTIILDAQGCLVTPGLVDAHTHLVYSGSREEEFILKTAMGLSYLEIENRGGGIPLTVTQTRTADLEELLSQANPVLNRMVSNGTTTIEAKSGYALNVDGELKILEAIRRLDSEGPMEIVPTLFGTHDIPIEYQDSRDDYFRLVVDELIPAVSRRGLACFCDSGTAFDTKKNG